MALSLFTVGSKITATALNLMVTALNANGQSLIIPTSVAGAGVSVGATGKVTFAAATAVSVNGCFSGTYDNYLIVLDANTSNAVSIDFRVRVAGVNETAAVYFWQGMTGLGAVVSAASAAGVTSIPITPALANAAQQRGTLLVQSPAATVATWADGSFTGVNTTSAAPTKNQRGGFVNNATSYDGFTVYVSAGTVTGSLRVYGLTN